MKKLNRTIYTILKKTFLENLKRFVLILSKVTTRVDPEILKFLMNLLRFYVEKSMIFSRDYLLERSPENLI